MKLYLAPGACSLAGHIALHEAGIDFERVSVDLRARRTGDGRDFATINPKGYVPALELDDGQLLTENVAILDWIAGRSPQLGAPGEMGRSRLLETLAFVSTEIHKQFSRVFRPSGDAEKEQALDRIDQRFAYIAERLNGNYLLGGGMTVADAYLYVMLRWAQEKGRGVPEALKPYKARLEARPAVRQALEHEGLAAKPA